MRIKKSKIEILEFVRKKGEVLIKDIADFFGKPTVYHPVYDLIQQGWLLKFKKVVVSTGVSRFTKRIYYSYKTRGKNFWVRLSPSAKRYLEKCGAKSFYDTPMAKRTKELYLRRPIKEFMRI